MITERLDYSMKTKKGIQLFYDRLAKQSDAYYEYQKLYQAILDLKDKNLNNQDIKVDNMMIRKGPKI